MSSATAVATITNKKKKKIFTIYNLQVLDFESRYDMHGSDGSSSSSVSNDTNSSGYSSDGRCSSSDSSSSGDNF